MIEIIPAIDIMDAKCVRLLQGNFSRQTIYCEKPIDIAKKIEAVGIRRIHLVDLDGAKAGRIINIRILEEIANQTNLIIDFGGGIKTDADMSTIFSAGAQIANIGSIAVQKPDIVLQWLAKYGKEKLLIGADVINKSIAINGWQKITDLDIFDFIGGFYKEGMRQFFCTDIQKDGMLLGPSTELYQEIIQRFPHISLIASGGISNIKDIEQLQSIGCSGAIVGKAWHEGIITNTFSKSNSMLTKRIIPCLDIKDGRVVKGVNFESLKDMGDPVKLATYYTNIGADELVFLDITATNEKRKTLVSLVSAVAAAINIPFTVGGGIGTVTDVHALLNAGADKVSINSAAITNPKLISQLANAFGSQCVVVAIDVKFIAGNWIVYTRAGKDNTGINLFSWIKQVTDLGAGEILLTSIDHDGTKNGFPIEMLRHATSITNLPIIASGGAGNAKHFKEVFVDGRADAALAAGIFHSKTLEIITLKKYLKNNNINIRL